MPSRDAKEASGTVVSPEANACKHRRAFEFDDARLDDRVADNLAKADITESESLLVGRSFGIVTDIQTGPDGALYLVGPAGTVRKIFRP